MTTWTFETASAAIAAGESTIQQIAAETGWPIIQGCLVPDPGTWVAADESGCQVVYEVGSGRDAAREYVYTGEWGEITETIWITVTAWQWGIDEDGDRCYINRSSHKVTLDPPEPDCIEGHEHDWQSPFALIGGIEENPGVWGHGAGVTISSVCIHCGCGKLTDTWAQDLTDGEQGLESVSYTPGQYADQIAAASE
jgi:hypothetical protein